MQKQKTRTKVVYVNQESNPLNKATNLVANTAGAVISTGVMLGAMGAVGGMLGGMKI